MTTQYINECIFCVCYILQYRHLSHDTLKSEQKITSRLLIKNEYGISWPGSYTALQRKTEYQKSL